ncbi:hypothetical protein CMV_010812 [Castanea mollissima]|uniref:CBM20 domain-containing protein n=1 Tax=Castanea mollissima TaxID=60419 RepID=A0A8J4RC22_9ROSI|nr:hypothetical protein CMV_010812 [Castanea mollissima]
MAEVEAHVGSFRFSSSFMDLHHLRRPFASSSSSSWLLRSHTSLSPYICHHIPFGNMFRFTQCIGNFNSFRRSPIMAIKKGKLNHTLKESCNVVWTIEADLRAGELLYITGDPVVFGCWEPEMAILMSPTEHANLWKAEAQLACGINFKYNYFIKGETQPFCDIIWRPGPDFSLSASGSSMGFMDRGDISSHKTFNISSSQSGLTDEYEIVKCLESDSIESKPFFNDLTIKDILYYKSEDTVSVTNDGSNFDKIFTERDQPVEEPWLLPSPLLFPVSEDKMQSDASNSIDTVKDDVTKMEDTRNLLPEEESNLVLKEPVSTVILINSSICTMQRIAVLEDGKLVELLLEPVKTNVQCDSVYLGVVTKLVPHMGGAFVNIGNSRPSLMDIKQNREPFIFPPFRQRTKKQEVNGSVIGTLEEHPSAHDIVINGDSTEVDSQDDFVQSMHNDYEEHEVEDDFDVSEVLKDNVNGSIVDYDEVEGDYEDYLDRSEHHIESETINGSLAADINGSNDSQISHLQHMKDSSHNFANERKWAQVRKGTKIVVQVVKEGLGTKGPTLTAYPKLRSRFWILIARCNRIGVSKKISGVERTRLKVIAKTLQPQGFGLTVRTVAAGRSLEELHRDLDGLLSTWKNIMEHAKSAALAADEGVEGAIPIILHTAMGQTLSVVQDYFNNQVQRMVVDSPRTYHEVTNYLQEIAPDLCDRVELYDKRIPLFSEFDIEEEINNILSKRVLLTNGGSLVIEQTEALVSIDVNGGHGVFGHGTSQEKAVLDVNLAAAKQIARELRLRDIGGIIVVDFIDMTDDSNKRLVYEEVKKAVERDRSMVKVSELSRHGLMEITRKRVRPSVTFMISEPCTCCHATGRVEALETSFSKIEQEICQLLATMDQKEDTGNPKSWPKFILRVDHHMSNYLTSGRRTRLAILSSSLKVWILLKVARGFTRGAFEVKPFTDDKANKNQHQATISRLRSAETTTNNSGKKVTLIPVKKWKTSGK